MDRQETIARIVAASRTPLPRIVERGGLVDPKTGREYSIFGIPFGVDPKALMPTRPYYVWQNRDGVTYGNRYETREAAIAHFEELEDRNTAEFRAILEAGTDEDVSRQADYWLKRRGETQEARQ